MAEACRKALHLVHVRSWLLLMVVLHVLLHLLLLLWLRSWLHEWIHALATEQLRLRLLWLRLLLRDWSSWGECLAMEDKPCSQLCRAAPTTP